MKESLANKKIGYAVTASFCTHARSLDALCALIDLGCEIVPIMSENAYYTDTRFGKAEDLSRKIEEITKRQIIHTVVDAEPLGPSEPLDALDTAATMAIKAHLRSDRPLLIALATNDAMSQNLGNIGLLLRRRSVAFVPMRQDSPVGKPHSLVAEFELIPECLESLLLGEQKRPLFL